MRAQLHRWFGESRWIPWGFVGFFLVVFAANGALVAFALNSWTGVETESAYEQGLRYNAALEAAKAQRELGWSAELDYASEGAQRGRLGLLLRDAEGRGIHGAAVVARFVRPSHEGHDFEAPLREVGDGRYAASVTLPLAGLWEIRMKAERGEVRFLASERIVAP